VRRNGTAGSRFPQADGPRGQRGSFRHGIEPDDLPTLTPELKRVPGLPLLQLVGGGHVIRGVEVLGAIDVAGVRIEMIESVPGHLTAP
jgi:hypothetical protein